MPNKTSSEISVLQKNTLRTVNDIPGKYPSERPPKGAYRGSERSFQMKDLFERFLRPL